MEVMDEIIIDNQLIPIIQAHLVHRFNQQMIAIVPAEALEMAKNMLKFLNFAENLMLFTQMVRSLRSFPY